MEALAEVVAEALVEALAEVVAEALVEALAIVVPVVTLVMEQDPVQAHMAPAQAQDPVQAHMAPAMAQATVELPRLTALVMGLVMTQVSDLVKLPVRVRT